MKSAIKFTAIAIFLYSCHTATPREQTLSKVQEFNSELEQAAVSQPARATDSLHSISVIDTTPINSKFYQLKMGAISKENLQEIEHELSFKRLLTLEKSLLSRWQTIPHFKSYANVKTSDTITARTRRCIAFDRAPAGAERVPAARGMRSVSLDYYTYEVPVAFHVITSSKGVGSQANINKRMADQIAILNSTYAKFNITFILFSTDVSANDNWFQNASYFGDTTALRQMTEALARNPEKVMNVYTNNSKYLGESTFPWYTTKGTAGDYIVMNFNALADGPGTFFEGRYMQGKTLVHEAGHFLGLLHTFEGGSPLCDSDQNDGCTIGDQVDDTPPQKICYFDGCDLNLKSCQDKPGNDPVKNFMGYNPDNCMTEFTKGQGDRMKQNIIRYRYYLVTNPI